jgi:hypothetical protein
MLHTFFETFVDVSIATFDDCAWTSPRARLSARLETVPFEGRVGTNLEDPAELSTGVVVAFALASTAIRLAAVDPAVSSSMQASKLRLSELESESESFLASRFFERGLCLRLAWSEAFATVDGVTVEVEVFVDVE